MFDKIKNGLKIVNNKIKTGTNIVLTFLVYFLGVSISSILWRLFESSERDEKKDSYYTSFELDDELESSKKMF